MFCTRATDNEIGDDGATALVEGLKELKNLKELNLRCEFWMIAKSCTTVHYVVVTAIAYRFDDDTLMSMYVYFTDYSQQYVLVLIPDNRPNRELLDYRRPHQDHIVD